MTAAPRVRAPAGVAGVERLIERRLPEFEAVLARSVGGLGEGLAWVEQASALAVGTEGRGGRRWRPLLTLAAAEATGTMRAAVFDVAVAVELTHTASLVLDDLPCMDDAATRRGLAATHRLVGSAGAILVSVGLLGRAAELISGVPQVGGMLGAAWGRAIGLDGMAGGQAVDVAFSGSARGGARRLMRRKTTALSALAAAGGAAAGGATPVAVAAIDTFGRDLGWAYQLADDADDLAEDDAAGRAAGGRSPRRQAAFLLKRAARHLAASGAVRRGGVELLTDFAAWLVPPAAVGA